MYKTLPTLENEKEQGKLDFTKDCWVSRFSRRQLKISKCSISLA